MTRISPNMIRSLITRNGRLFVPQKIAEIVGSCVASDLQSVVEAGDRLKAEYEAQNPLWRPIKIDYSAKPTVDAYTVYYLPRNTLVPRVAMMCCAHHPMYQQLPDTLRVLDMGSGTGGVVLGLLDLFSNKQLRGTTIEVTAVDSSSEGLDRQRRLAARIGYSPRAYEYLQMDFESPQAHSGVLAARGPYDMVFAANLFAELSVPATDALLEQVVPALSDDAFLVDVESNSNWAKAQCVHVVKKTKSLGLHVYYPCPPVPCPKSHCWMWHEREFDCPPISVAGNYLETTKIHKAHWLVFSTRPLSIYDVLNGQDPSLTWGVAAPDPRTNSDDYEFCTENGLKRWAVTRKPPVTWLATEAQPLERGRIVGVVGEGQEIACSWDIINGFAHYDH